MTEKNSHLDFKPTSPAPTETVTPLSVALDVRKFEVGLYWTRASYYWAFNAAIIAGYFLVWTSKGSDHANSQSFDSMRLLFCEVLSGLGLVFSVSWYLANRGGKYWQDNWESRVAQLEDNALGSLFKGTLDKEWKPISFGAYPKSVTRINTIVSLFILIFRTADQI